MMALLQRSLKTRVTLFTLAIFVISLWALAYYTTRTLREDMQRLLGEQQFSVVSLVGADINHELGDRLSALENAAQAVTPAVLGYPAAMQTFLEGRQVLQSLFNGGLLVTDMDGATIGDSLPGALRIGVNYLHVDSVAAALKEGRSTVSSPLMSKKLRAPVFGITVPIRDHQGKVIGSLGGAVDLGKPSFLGRIAERHYGSTGDYLIVSKRHRVIVTSSDRRRVMQPLPALDTFPVLEQFVGGYEGTVTWVNPLGEQVLQSVKGIPAADWYVAIALPTAEAFAPIRDMQQRMLLATIFLTLLVGSLTWWMLRRQLAPMLEAAQALASQSAAGLPPQPLPIMRQDEVGNLIGGFNRLLLTLGQREETLKQSEATFRKLFSDSSDGILLIDDTGVFVECNQAALDLLKMTREQFLRPSPSRISPEFQPDGQRSADAAPEMIALAYSKGLHRFEWTCVNAEGGEFILDVSLLPITIQGKTMLHTAWRDITERKRIEAALQQQANEIQWLMKSMFTAFVVYESVFDQDGHVVDSRYVYVNDAYERLSGLKLEAIQGKTVLEVWPGVEPGWFDIHNEVAITGNPKAFEIHRAPTQGLYACNAYRPWDTPDRICVVIEDITERRRVEEALKLSEATYREIFNAINDVIWIHDIETFGLLDVNHKVTEMFGYSVREALDLSVEDVRSGVPPFTLEKAAEFMKKAVVGEPQLFEWHCKHKDGHFFWSEVSLRRATIAGKECILAIERDITTRKQAEHALQESEATFRKLFESSSDGILLIDDTGVFVECNQAALDLLKMTREQFLRLSPSQISPEFQPDGRHSADAAPEMVALAYSKGLHRFEWTCVNAEGGEFIIEVSLLPITIQGKTMLHNAWRDITERKRAEKALERHRMGLRQIIDLMPEMLWLKDVDGRFLMVNQANARNYGMSVEALTGRLHSEVHSDKEEISRMLLDDRRVIDTGAPVFIPEESFLGTDGLTRYLQTTKIPFDFAETGERAILGMAVDITERKRAEEELQRHRGRLEELVTERTAELRQAMVQLVQSEKLAALGSLVAGVAHELNTPLGNARVVASSLGTEVRNFAAAVDAGALRRSQVATFLERSREGVELLERNAARAADLISHFKQVAVDQTSTRRRRFNLRQTVEEVLITLQPQFKRTAHRIEREIPPDLELDSYPGPLEQVIANLIGNSLIHGFAGKEAGCIRIEAAPLDAGRIRLRYGDDGAGIPETIRNRIFEPFFTTKLGGGGSGLGLYIVYNLVTGVLGGTVQVQNPPGLGVAFDLILPTVAPALPTPAPRVS